MPTTPCLLTPIHLKQRQRATVRMARPADAETEARRRALLRLLLLLSPLLLAPCRAWVPSPPPGLVSPPHSVWAWSRRRDSDRSIRSTGGSNKASRLIDDAYRPTPTTSIGALVPAMAGGIIISGSSTTSSVCLWAQQQQAPPVAAGGDGRG